MSLGEGEMKAKKTRIDEEGEDDEEEGDDEEEDEE